MYKNDDELIKVNNNGKIYYVSKCYCLNTKLRKRYLNKSDLISFVKDKNDILKTYCVLEKGHKPNEYFVVDGCNLENDTIELATDDFFKKIFKRI